MSEYWCRLEDRTCAEVINHDPEGRYHPDIVWAKIPPGLVSWTDRNYTVDENGLFSAPIEYVLSQVVAQAAAARYDIENQSILQITSQSGTTFSVPIQRDTRTILIPALTAAATRATSLFKIGGAKISLSAQDAADLVRSIYDYIQLLYDREQDIVECVTAYTIALTDTQEDIINLISEYRRLLAEGWPSKDITLGISA